MKDTFTSARLVQSDLIRLIIFSSAPYDRLEASLVTDRKTYERIVPAKVTSTASLLVADFRLKEPLALGHSYAISLSSYGLVPVDVSEATSFSDFDEKYTYDGDDLGASFSSERTSFALWAPLASFVWLKIRKKGESEWHYFEMSRFPFGVYRFVALGDYELAEYLYCVTNNEVTTVATDPYAKGSAPNGEASVVVNPRKFLPPFKREALPVLNCYTDAVIYEGNVRDLTIDRHTDIVHKGQFLGLAEPGRKTEGGNPAGLDYLKSLLITHLQLQPLFDFKTVDERDPSKAYNWGYDPAQYFVPEGSYASNVEDPYSRIEDLQRMVAALHEAGIRVSMDCVYNHVYEYASSVFERIVPNYYFRRRGNGKMANTSYCGDDVATEKPMCRKLIVDCCEYWIETYGIDAFRFDLMGIMDAETMEQIAKMAKRHDPSFMLYGEGWNMGGEVSAPLASMDNYKLLPQYAFFNDRFRDNYKKWLVGDDSEEVTQGVAHAYVSSSLDFYHPARFLSAEQSLNYIECHDNETFFDYVSSRDEGLPLQEKLAICKFGLAAVLTSYGIPFIHAGEEIGQSKYGKGNTYNLPDVYNKFSYRLLDERKAMYDYFRGLVLYRKQARYLHIYDPRVIDPILNVETLPHGVMKVTIADGAYTSPASEIICIYNPSRESVSCALNGECSILVDQSGYVAPAGLKEENALVSPHSLLVAAKPMAK
jgi:pullulanase